MITLKSYINESANGEALQSADAQIVADELNSMFKAKLRKEDRPVAQARQSKVIDSTCSSVFVLFEDGEGSTHNIHNFEFRWWNHKGDCYCELKVTPLFELTKYDKEHSYFALMSVDSLLRAAGKNRSINFRKTPAEEGNEKKIAQKIFDYYVKVLPVMRLYLFGEDGVDSDDVIYNNPRLHTRDTKIDKPISALCAEAGV